MPNWGYSVKAFDPDRAVRCSGRELKISPKAATEICRKLRGMRLEQAKKLLEAVQQKKRAIAYRRYKKEVPHRSLDEGWYAGRYPVKAAKTFLFLLEELESNAEYKGLDVDRLRIVHAASQRGMKSQRIISRAMGRATAYHNTLVHIELMGYEVAE
ncbi:MAG TPA: 50S ribosomal protein L22 [Candidatus Acidoferrum sp.]|nr:50S ribosomal protein L22 [Candidatus Acidoferrum sp.]